MKRLAILSTIFVLLAGVAYAQDDREPPASVFKQGELRQAGRLGSYCWSWQDESGSGGGKCVDTFRSDWPRLKEAAKGRRARITIKYPDLPDEISLTYWRRVDNDQQPVGEGTPIEFTSSSRSTDGGTVWDLTFETPGYRGRFYMRGFFAWNEKGDGFYHWRLKLN